eukprot:scaffold49980_cov78-Phaeocystis_antarctica.AAC.2
MTRCPHSARTLPAIRIRLSCRPPRHTPRSPRSSRSPPRSMARAGGSLTRRAAPRYFLRPLFQGRVSTTAYGFRWHSCETGGEVAPPPPRLPVYPLGAGRKPKAKPAACPALGRSEKACVVGAFSNIYVSRHTLKVLYQPPTRPQRTVEYCSDKTKVVKSAGDSEASGLHPAPPIEI